MDFNYHEVSEKRELDFSNYPLINDAIRGGFNRYAFYHLKPGGFLSACLQGDINAFVLADYGNAQTETFRQIVQFMHNELPPDCHGSVDRFLEHLKKREIGK